MSGALFAYGTLVLPAVWEALTGRRALPRAARLADYARRPLRGALYPGIAPEAGAWTPGVLHPGIDAATWALLDAFEGPLYQRRRVQVTVEGGGRAAVWAYVVRPAERTRLAAGSWDPRAFAARHLPRYVAGCRAFRAGFRPGAAQRRRPSP